MESATATNPYVGPRAYRRDEAHLFFGREQEAAELLSLVVSQHVVVFNAQSGAGKSSLLNARLVPQLEQEGFSVLPIGRISGALPEGVADDDVTNIFVYNLLLSLQGEEQVATELAQTSLRSYLEKTQSAETSARVLIIDQFEEIFTAHLDRWQDRKVFFQQLGAAVRHDPLLWVVLTMREDFVSGLDPFAESIPGNLRVRYYMQRLRALAADGLAVAQSALDVVEAPARIGGRPFDEDVAAILIRNLSRVTGRDPTETQAGEYLEPLQLQVVCQQLWEMVGNDPDCADPDCTISAEHVNSLDVNTALGRFYDDTIAAVIANPAVDASESVIRNWFENELITEGGTRGTVYQNEETGKTGTLDNAVVAALAGNYLLRLQERSRGIWVEIVHDRFVRPIRNSNAAWRQQQTPLYQDALAWDRAEDEAKAALLYTGSKLEGTLAGVNPDRLEDVERNFLDAGRREDAILRTRRRNRNLLLLIGGIALASAIVIGVISFALVQTRTERRRAVQQSVAARALRIADRTQDNTLGALLAIEAFLLEKETGDSVRDQVDLTLRTLLGEQGLLDVLRDHDGVVRELRFSADGRWLASVGDDDTILVRDMWAETDNDPLRLTEHSADVRSVDFSPDGQWMVSADHEGGVILWQLSLSEPESADDSVVVIPTATFFLDRDAAQSRSDSRLEATPIPLPPSHTTSVRSVTFSPDNRHFATAGDNAAIRLWDVENPDAAPLLLPAPDTSEKRWRHIAFNPDGTMLGGANVNGNVYLYDSADWSAPPRELVGHNSTVYGVAFSPDSQLMATIGFADDTVRLWDIRSLQEARLIKTLRGHTDSVTGIAFAPDGRTLASSSYDRTIILWDVSEPENAVPVRLIKAADDLLERITFDPVTGVLVSGGHDNMVRIWDAEQLITTEAEPRVLIGNGAWINEFAADAERQLIATADTNGIVRLWDVGATPKELAALTGPEPTGVGESVWSLALSPDGQTLALGTHDGSLQLRNAADSAEIATASNAHGSEIRDVAFDPAGTLLASAGTDGTVQLRASDDLSAPLWSSSAISPTVVTDVINAVAFHPDRPIMATGSDDGRVVLWDVADSAMTVPFAVIPLALVDGEVNGVTDVAFSPTQPLLAAAERDGRFTLWDISRLSRPRIVSQWHGPDGILLEFSPDGALLATSGSDNDVTLWDVSDPAAPKLVQTLPGHTSRSWYVAFSNDGLQLASASADATVQIWDLSGAAKPQLIDRLVGHDKWVRGVAFSADGNTLYTAGDDQTLRTWSLRDDRPGPTAYVWTVDIATERSLLAAAGFDGHLYLWDIGDPAAPQPVAVRWGQGTGIHDLEFSPDERFIAAGTDDGKVVVWNISDPTNPMLTALNTTEHTDAVQGVVFRPDGRWLATAGDDETIVLWEVDASGVISPVNSLTGHSEWISGLAFNGDGTLLASSADDKTVRVWDVTDPNTASEKFVLQGHKRGVRDVAFAPTADGNDLVSGGVDNIVLLWDLDLPDPNFYPFTLSGHSDWVWYVAFSDDGRYALTAGRDGTVRRWTAQIEDLIDLVCGQVTQSGLTEQEQRDYLPGEGREQTCPVDWEAFRER